VAPALCLAGLALAQSDPLIEGLTQFRQGDYMAAQTSFRKVLAAGENARASAFLALSRAATGECAAVLDDLRSAFENSAEAELRRLAGLGLSQCHLAANRVEAAFPILARLKSDFPDDVDVLYQSAKLHMKAWNDVVYEMFRKTPASFRVNQVSAEIFEVQAQYKEAIAEYRKAIEKNPKALNLHFRLGRALLMDSHSPQALAEARREFEAELALNPNDAVAEYQIGQILVAQQNSAEAATRFERALELNSDFSEALIALGKLRLEAGRHEEAIRLLERAVVLLPRSEAARYSLMLAYRNAGRPADALRIKEELEKLQQPPEGEFTEFLRRIGEKPARQ